MPKRSWHSSRPICPARSGASNRAAAVEADRALGGRRGLAVGTGGRCATDDLLEAVVAAHGDQVFVAGAARLTAAGTVPQSAIAIRLARGQGALAKVIDGAALVDAARKEPLPRRTCLTVAIAALHLIVVFAIVGDEVVRGGVSAEARRAAVGAAQHAISSGFAGIPAIAATPARRLTFRERLVQVVGSPTAIVQGRSTQPDLSVVRVVKGGGSARASATGGDRSRAGSGPGRAGSAREFIGLPPARARNRGRYEQQRSAKRWSAKTHDREVTDRAATAGDTAHDRAMHDGTERMPRAWFCLSHVGP